MAFHIQTPGTPTLGAALGKGLGGGLESFAKEYEKGLEKRRKYQDALKKEKGKSSSIIRGLLKDYQKEGLLEDKELDDLRDLTNELIDEGLTADAAADLAFRQYRQRADQFEEPEEKRLSEKEGGLVDLISGRAEKRSPLEGLKEASIRQKREAEETGLQPREHPLELLKGLFSVDPSQRLSQLERPLIKTPLAGIGEQERERRATEEAGLSPRERLAREKGRELGTAVALEAIPLGPIVKLLPKKGIDFLSRQLGKIAKKTKATPKEVGEAFQKFSKEVPSGRLEETKEIPKLLRDFGKSEVYQKDLLKRAKKPRVAARVEEEAARARAPIKPEAEVKAAAQESLPKDSSDYLKVYKERKGVESSLRKGEKKYSPSHLSRLKTIEKEAAEHLKKSQYEAFTGMGYKSSRSIAEDASKALNRVEELAKKGEEGVKDFEKVRKRFALNKANETLIKDMRKAKVPLEEATNTYARVTRGYADAVLDRLKDVEKQLKTSKNFEKIMELGRERNMLQELLDLSKKKVELGDMRATLSRINKYQKAQAKIGKEVPLSDKALKEMKLTRQQFKKIAGDVGDAVGKTITRGQKVNFNKIREELGKTAPGMQAPLWKRMFNSPYLSSAVQKLIKHKTGKTVPRWLVTAGLYSLGGSLGYKTVLSPKSLITKGTQALQQQKLNSLVKNGRKAEARKYVQVLRKKGISKKKTIEMYQKAIKSNAKGPTIRKKT